MKVFDDYIRPILILFLLLILVIMGYSVGKLSEFLESDFYKNNFRKKVLPKPENELHFQREEDTPLG